MKMSLLGLLRLKPFDESDDKKSAGNCYADSTLMTISIVVGSLMAVLALVLAITGKSALALDAILVAVGASAITAGLEWHKGLKARAMNQLIVAALSVTIVVILTNTNA